MLIEKVMSETSCVSAWKQRYDNRRSRLDHDRRFQLSTTVAPTVTVTRKTCVERWEQPCGNTSRVIRWPSTAFGQPSERQQFERQMTDIVTMIYNVTQTVHSLVNDNKTVSHALFANCFLLCKCKLRM